MADLLNGLPDAIRALEHGEVVKCSTITFFRKKNKWTSEIEAYNHKIGAWTTYSPGHFDVCGDYEISTDPLAPPAEPEPLAIEAKTKETTE